MNQPSVVDTIERLIVETGTEHDSSLATAQQLSNCLASIDNTGQLLELLKRLSSPKSAASGGRKARECIAFLTFFMCCQDLVQGPAHDLRLLSNYLQIICPTGIIRPIWNKFIADNLFEPEYDSLEEHLLADIRLNMTMRVPPPLIVAAINKIRDIIADRVCQNFAPSSRLSRLVIVSLYKWLSKLSSHNHATSTQIYFETLGIEAWIKTKIARLSSDAILHNSTIVLVHLSSKFLHCLEVWLECLNCAIHQGDVTVLIVCLDNEIFRHLDSESDLLLHYPRFNFSLLQLPVFNFAEGAKVFSYRGVRSTSNFYFYFKLALARELIVSKKCNIIFSDCDAYWFQDFYQFCLENLKKYDVLGQMAGGIPKALCDFGYGSICTGMFALSNRDSTVALLHEACLQTLRLGDDQTGLNFALQRSAIKDASPTSSGHALHSRIGYHEITSLTLSSDIIPRKPFQLPLKNATMVVHNPSNSDPTVAAKILAYIKSGGE